MDIGIPSRLGPAYRAALWGAAPFIFFMAAVIEGAIAGNYPVAGACAVLFVLSVPVIVYWDKIASPAWRRKVAFALVAVAMILLVVAFALLAIPIGQGDKSIGRLEWLSIGEALQRFPLGVGDDRFTNLESQLKTGAFIARGFPYPAGNEMTGPVLIDAARWQYLHLERGPNGLGQAGGGMSRWVGIQVAKTDAEVAAPAVKKIYLKEAYIFGGQAGIDPRFSAKFSRGGTKARFYVDDSYYLGNFGASGWTDRKRIPIALPILDFVAEQTVNIPILTSVTGPPTADGSPPSPLRRWGDGKTEVQTIYSANVQHRGRVVFIADDATEEYFYFIILMAPVQETPTVIGQFNFDFTREWELQK